MLKKYFSHFLVFLITALFFIIILMFYRYETDTVSLDRGGVDCLIVTNMMTGSSCLVGGSSICDSPSRFDLKKCN